MKRWLGVLLTLASLTPSAGALAQGSDLERAKASFRAGANAYAA